jgi:hypothetical protein
MMALAPWAMQLSNSSSLLVGIVVVDELEGGVAKFFCLLGAAISCIEPKNGFSTPGTITQIKPPASGGCSGCGSLQGRFCRWEQSLCTGRHFRG